MEEKMGEKSVRDKEGKFRKGHPGGPGRGHKATADESPEDLFDEMSAVLKKDLKSKTDSTRLKAVNLLLKLQQVREAWQEQQSKGQVVLPQAMMQALQAAMEDKMQDEDSEIIDFNDDEGAGGAVR